MRILFVTPTLPVPTSGGRTRVFNLIKQLAARHEISVLSFIQPSEYEMLSVLEPLCRHLELEPFEGFEPLGKWQNRFQGWGRILFSTRPPYAYTFPVDRLRRPLRKLCRSQAFDAIVFQSLFVAELAEEIGNTLAVLTEENIESDIAEQVYLQATDPIHWLRDRLMWRKLVAFERHWVRRFPVCVAVSEGDARRLREMSPTTKVHVAPNGVDSQYFAPPGGARDPETLLFFGTLSYQPNAEGLVWFCQQVLPRIREARPRATLEIAGLDAPPEVTELGQLPGVHFTGFVPDIRIRLWSATACVVPLHVGGGTRLKILEALAAGSPVISTTIGAEGLALGDGEHLLLADTADEFARGTVSLLESKDLQRRLAAAGQQVVARKYDWSQIASQLEAALEHAIDLRAGAAPAWTEQLAVET